MICALMFINQIYSLKPDQTGDDSENLLQNHEENHRNIANEDHHPTESEAEQIQRVSDLSQELLGLAIAEPHELTNNSVLPDRVDALSQDTVPLENKTDYELLERKCKSCNKTDSNTKKIPGSHLKSDEIPGNSSYSGSDEQPKIHRKKSLKERRKNFIKKRLSFDKCEFPQRVERLSVHEQKNAGNALSPPETHNKGVLNDSTESDSLNMKDLSLSCQDSSDLAEKKQLTKKDETAEFDHYNRSLDREKYATTKKKLFDSDDSKDFQRKDDNDISRSINYELLATTDIPESLPAFYEKNADFSSMNRGSNHQSKSKNKYKKMCYKLTRKIENLLQADELKQISYKSNNMNEILALIEKLNDLKYLNEQMMGYISCFSSSDTDTSVLDTLSESSLLKQQEKHLAVKKNEPKDVSILETDPSQQEKNEKDDDNNQLPIKELPVSKEDDLIDLEKEDVTLHTALHNVSVKLDSEDEKNTIVDFSTKSEQEENNQNIIENTNEIKHQYPSKPENTVTSMSSQNLITITSDKFSIIFKEGLLFVDTMKCLVEKTMFLLDSVHEVLNDLETPSNSNIQVFTTALLEVVEECNKLRRLVEDENPSNKNHPIVTSYSNTEDAILLDLKD